MNNTSLNITNKLETPIIKLLMTVDQATCALGIPYVIVGATARDMIFQHGYGRKPERATVDIDMAIHVRHWADFNLLQDHLLAVGFRKGSEVQRFYSTDNIPLDVVPFGGIEDSDKQIAWPPDGNVVMNLMGFSEANNTAIKIIIQDEPQCAVPVVTPPAMALLKLVSWTDRAADKRKRDAQDLVYLLKQYEHIPDVRERIYTSESVLEKYSFDTGLVGANLLGLDAAAIAALDTKEHINTLLNGGMTARKLNVDTLLRESMERFDQEELDKRYNWIEAFRDGFSCD
ncbi:MAG: nucleotidyl transferase AbiEii/AbiGii toxin family protein [Cellvibrionales bacterium]|nr:nucleotidyl transferase AbiEii/AbiGii toxin family protein [Cellvibrionales bacterium]